MVNLITLHYGSGFPFVLNAEAIEYMEWSQPENLTIIQGGREVPYKATETPDQIQALINPPAPTPAVSSKAPHQCPCQTLLAGPPLGYNDIMGIRYGAGGGGAGGGAGVWNAQTIQAEVPQPRIRYRIDIRPWNG